MKTKWFNANFPAGFDVFYETIVNSPFDIEKGWGLTINSYERSYMSARYIEKVEINEVVIDPYGNENNYTQVKYVQFDFVFHENKRNGFFFIIESPPRSLKNFVKNVINSSGSDFSISTMNLNISNFIKSLPQYLEDSYVSKLKVKGLTFNSRTSGSLEIESTGNALEELKNIFKKENYTIEKAKVNFRKNNFHEYLEISSNGSMKFSFDTFENLSDIILTIESMNEIDFR